MGGTQPVHYEPETVKELTKELLVASGIGAVRGAAIGITTALLLRRFSTVYKNVRTQVRVFYHISWISMGAVFYADKQLIKFQNRYYENETKRRSRILDEAAERGIFLEDDAAVASTTS
ncbi:LAME_0H17810g1_1 [Lachancea meyersii CBS 8951]|uniref:LAME_0H17810g1_1 n=1 Tax=Lachancea meyersii CBS 8951 TaxID=1266667 RepID=A0A1G4KIQ4_9SACH|nr:LAME_0H17810g1_1 [Lachancea meyersii CBS 8951]